MAISTDVLDMRLLQARHDKEPTINCTVTGTSKTMHPGLPSAIIGVYMLDLHLLESWQQCKSVTVE